MAKLDADQVLSDFGRRVAEVRRKRDLTQEQLAGDLGVSYKFVQRIEAGMENMSIRRLVKLANALDLERLAELFQAPRSKAERRPGRPRRQN